MCTKLMWLNVTFFKKNIDLWKWSKLWKQSKLKSRLERWRETRGKTSTLQIHFTQTQLPNSLNGKLSPKISLNEWRHVQFIVCLGCACATGSPQPSSGPLTPMHNGSFIYPHLLSWGKGWLSEEVRELAVLGSPSVLWFFQDPTQPLLGMNRKGFPAYNSAWVGLTVLYHFIVRLLLRTKLHVMMGLCDWHIWVAFVSVAIRKHLKLSKTTGPSSSV